MASARPSEGWAFLLLPRPENPDIRDPGENAVHSRLLI